MIETYYDQPTKVPVVACDHCGRLTKTQVYTLTLTREKVEREWRFDTMECLRDWVKPAR